MVSNQASNFTLIDREALLELTKAEAWKLIEMRANRLMASLRSQLGTSPVLHDPIENARIHGIIRGVENMLELPGAFAKEIEDEMEASGKGAKKKAEAKPYETPRLRS